MLAKTISMQYIFCMLRAIVYIIGVCLVPNKITNYRCIVYLILITRDTAVLNHIIANQINIILDFFFFFAQSIILDLKYLFQEKIEGFFVFWLTHYSNQIQRQKSRVIQFEKEKIMYIFDNLFFFLLNYIFDNLCNKEDKSRNI